LNKLIQISLSIFFLNGSLSCAQQAEKSDDNHLDKNVHGFLNDSDIDNSANESSLWDCEEYLQDTIN